jgi:hypothetical protein
MWNTDSLWVELAVMNVVFALGHIFFGHFEERTPRWRKFLKYVVFVILFTSLSHYFGRAVALSILGVMFLAVRYIHGIVLPKKGINGWTGEPKGKYYDFRGWSRDIFHDK